MTTPVPSPAKPPLTGRTIGLLAAAALVIPLVTVVSWLIGVAGAGPSGELAGFGPYFCRRGNCIGQPDAVIDSSVIALVQMIPLTFGVAAAGFLIALLTRRRGWLTIPSILWYVFVLMVSVNTAAYTVTGGAQVVGTIIIGVFAIGIPLAVVALGRAALGGRRMI